MEDHRVCPWWMGYLLLIPLRKMRHDPEKMLGEYIKKGMKVIDYGSAMGYFSIPIARMVGSEGKVYCFDIQEKMLNKLASRSKKVKLDKIIEPRLVSDHDAFEGLSRTIDFALLFFVAHEVPDQQELFNKLTLMFKPGGILYFAEPAGHVKLNDFEQSLDYAEKSGFKKIKTLELGKNYATLLEKS